VALPFCAGMKQVDQCECNARGDTDIDRQITRKRMPDFSARFVLTIASATAKKINGTASALRKRMRIMPTWPRVAGSKLPAPRGDRLKSPRPIPREMAMRTWTVGFWSVDGFMESLEKTAGIPVPVHAGWIWGERQLAFSPAAGSGEFRVKFNKLLCELVIGNKINERFGKAMGFPDLDRG